LRGFYHDTWLSVERLRTLNVKRLRRLNAKRVRG